MQGLHYHIPPNNQRKDCSVRICITLMQLTLYSLGALLASTF